MEHILDNEKLELFFGVMILFFSFAGILGYINPDVISNIYFFVVFLLGIMLGSILVTASLTDYFEGNKFATPRRIRKRR